MKLNTGINRNVIYFTLASEQVDLYDQLVAALYLITLNNEKIQGCLFQDRKAQSFNSANQLGCIL